VYSSQREAFAHARGEKQPPAKKTMAKIVSFQDDFERSPQDFSVDMKKEKSLLSLGCIQGLRHFGMLQARAIDLSWE
jgi:hypothetical protein